MSERGDFIMNKSELAWFENYFGVKAYDVFDVIESKGTTYEYLGDSSRKYAYKEGVPLEFKRRVAHTPLICTQTYMIEI